MANVEKIHFKNGDAPVGAGINAAYDDLETEASNVDSSNTASSWMTLKHISNAAFQFNRLDKYTNDTSATTSYNSTSYTTIAQGGVDAEIVYSSFFPDNSQITRFCASGLVSTVTLATDNDEANYYAFRLLLTYDDGAGDVTATIGEWGYSFSARSLNTNSASLLADPIQFQTFQFSTLVRYDGTSGDREYKKITLQVKVNDATNTVGITRHQVFSISAKR